MFKAEQIRQEIADQLQMPIDQLTDDDDLLLIGLDSIRLMVLVDGWRKAGAKITYADVAAKPTLTGIFQHLGLSDQVNA